MIAVCPFGESALSSTLFRHLTAALCVATVVLGALQTSCGQQGSQSSALPFRQRLNPNQSAEDQSKERAEKHNKQLQANSGQRRPPGSGRGRVKMTCSVRKRLSTRELSHASDRKLSLREKFSRVSID